MDRGDAMDPRIGQDLVGEVAQLRRGQLLRGGVLDALDRAAPVMIADDSREDHDASGSRRRHEEPAASGRGPMRTSCRFGITLTPADRRHEVEERCVADRRGVRQELLIGRERATGRGPRAEDVAAELAPDPRTRVRGERHADPLAPGQLAGAGMEADREFADGHGGFLGSRESSNIDTRCRRHKRPP
jgi:hypothetical protein